jgi:NAD(P)-dependent dehydrogenase (short-subunit alcohol dehydrogenase family)
MGIYRREKDDSQMIESVLITGADRGVGLALALRFLEGGYRVFAGRRGVQSSSELLKLEQKYPDRLTSLMLDVTDVETIRLAVEKVSSDAGAVDILINNAGVHLEDGSLKIEALDFTDGHLEKTFAVNTFGPLRVTQAFLPLLDRGKRKTVVNVSSEAGSISDCYRQGEYAYCMSKAALNMQSRILHNYLTPRGYTVLAVHPGWVRTDMGGPNADISPTQSAEGIFDRVNREWLPVEPIYLDYQGVPKKW